MRHRDKKIKFRAGKDANKMLVRKLLFNFFSNGKIETTLAKAKVIKTLVDKSVARIVEETEANKNYLLKLLNNGDLVVKLFKETGPMLKDKPKGGYIRIVRLLDRNSDAAEVARVEWVYPVIKENHGKPDKIDKTDKRK